jgi:hypothetical protein
MMLSTLLGFFYVVITIIHAVWSLSATVRAKKSSRLLQWPLSNRWVLGLYVSSLTLMFADFARVRFRVGNDLFGDEWRLVWVGFVLVMSLITFWRWLSGSLLNYGERK